MLNEQVSPRTLGVVRVLIYALWFRKIYSDPVYQLAQLPIDIFSPLGVLRLIPTSFYEYLFTVPVLWTLKMVTLIGLVLLIFGVGPYRCIAIFTCLLLTVHQGLVQSFGTISHGELCLLYAAYVLAVFPAADGFSLRRGTSAGTPPVMYAAPMIAIAFIISLTYAFVGAYRLATSTPEIFLDGTILRFVVLRSPAAGIALPQCGLWALEQPWLAPMLQIGFPIITLFEVLAPLCLISPRFRWIWIAVMIAFHLTVLCLMKISFLSHILLILLFFTNIDRLLARWLPKSNLPATYG